MPKTDLYESELLAAFEKDALKSVATKAELLKFKAVARAGVAQCASWGVASLLPFDIAGQA